MQEVFIISDGTGITAESLAHALLSQFSSIEFSLNVLPYIDTVEKAKKTLLEIKSTCEERTAQGQNSKPLILSTLVNPEIREIFAQSNICSMDLFAQFLGPLENILQTPAKFTVGHAHGMVNLESYQSRIDAINFVLATDDGVGINRYEHADIILLGVSRSGKTPTSLYLALQCGIRAANYPLTKEELISQTLPENLKPHTSKCYGLTIDGERLQAIREERRPNSSYSSKQQCLNEIKEAEHLLRLNGISYINTTHLSVEEIATKIMAATKLNKRI